MCSEVCEVFPLKFCSPEEWPDGKPADGWPGPCDDNEDGKIYHWNCATGTEGFVSKKGTQSTCAVAKQHEESQWNKTLCHRALTIFLNTDCDFHSATEHKPFPTTNHTFPKRAQNYTLKQERVDFCLQNSFHRYAVVPPPLYGNFAWYNYITMCEGNGKDDGDPESWRHQVHLKQSSEGNSGGNPGYITKRSKLTKFGGVKALVWGINYSP